MIRLEKINGKNVWEILELRVGEAQKSFVAPNDVSIIEACAQTGRKEQILNNLIKIIKKI